METKLVYFQWDYDDTVYVRLMTDEDLIKCIDSMDYTGFHIVKIFDISEPTNIHEIHYVGWQPNCLIEFTDDKGNVVLRGYGEDH